MQFKLTFNKPAYKTFFEGEEAKGIRVKVFDGVAMFKPVTTDSGADVVPISYRGRGGVEAQIEGHLAETVLSALKNPHGNAFFMLSRAKGWIVTEPYDGSKSEPPRFLPQLRVWAKPTERPFPTELVNEIQNMGMTQFLTEVRDAKNLIAEYDSQKRPGRPPKEVSEARDLLRLFSEVSREVLPLDPVRQAHTLLGDYLGVSDLTNDDDTEAAEALAETKAAQPQPKAPVPPQPEAKRPAAVKPSSATVVATQTAPKRRGRPPLNREPHHDPEEERIAAEAAAKLGVELPSEQRVRPKRRLKMFEHA